MRMPDKILVDERTPAPKFDIKNGINDPIIVKVAHEISEASTA